MLAALDGSAFAILDIASGRTLSEQRADWIDTPVWPGSIAKIATFAGALESGALTADTRVTCTRRLRLADGREVDCSHPEIGHPLSLTEALAHSCNLFAATIARSMTPAALARGFARVGLPAPPAQGDRVGIALGLTGRKIAPRMLLEVMSRVARPTEAQGRDSADVGDRAHAARSTPAPAIPPAAAPASAVTSRPRHRAAAVPRGPLLPGTPPLDAGSASDSASVNGTASAQSNVGGARARGLASDPLALIRDGLRESARRGTASAFADAGIDALAKTGTALMPNGHPLGLVIAAWPAEAPREAIVLAMPGGTGTQAASLAALLAQRRASPAASTHGIAATSSIASAPGAASAAGEASGAGAAAPSTDAAMQGTSAAPIVLRIGTPNGASYRVEEVPLEDYVASVVTGETSDATPEAVRDALAITARTYALANRHRHADDGFDLCRLTHCQVARPAASPAARRVAERTRGLVLRIAKGNASGASVQGGGAVPHASDPAEAIAENRAAGERNRRAAQPAASRVHASGEAVASAPVQVFYSASCGGRLGDASAVLPTVARGALPWMTERDDPAGVSEVVWTTELRADDLNAALQRAGLRGDRLRHLAAQRANPRDRDVARIALDGLTPSELRADDFRRIVGQQLGWEKLKSLRFTVARTASGYRFEGQGHGHGVGLCVTGASALAAHGASAERLLATYFPGLTIAQAQLSQTQGAQAAAASAAPAPGAATAASSAATTSSTTSTLSRLAPPSPKSSAATSASATTLDLRLPSEQERERDLLRDIIATNLDRLARDLGVTPPARLAVIVHPTGESYRRATGRAWWTSATMVEERQRVAIHLIPLTALRRNGRLQTTLRHELVHVLTTPALRTRPLWVQEGVAIHYAADPRDRAAAQEEARRTAGPRQPTTSAGAAAAADAGPAAAAAAAAGAATTSAKTDVEPCPDDRAFRQTSDRAITERAYRAAAACVARELANGRTWRDLGGAR